MMKLVLLCVFLCGLVFGEPCEYPPSNCVQCEDYTCQKCGDGYYLEINQCVQTCPPTLIADDVTGTCVCPEGLTRCHVDGHEYPGSYVCYNATIETCCAVPGTGDTHGEICPGLAPEYSCCVGYKQNRCTRTADQYCCTDSNPSYATVCGLGQGCCGSWPSCFDKSASHCCPEASTYGFQCPIDQICINPHQCGNCSAGTFANTTSQTCDNCPVNCAECTADGCTVCACGFSLVSGECVDSSRQSKRTMHHRKMNRWN